MKKILSLSLAILMVISLFGAMPTVFAEEIDYTVVGEAFGKTYWKSFYEKTDDKNTVGVIQVGDWYYKYTKNKTTQDVTLSVCGYNGTETDIIIPTKLGGISIYHLNEFYVLSKTVKTVTIPKEITKLNTDIPGEYYDYIMTEGHWYDKNHNPIIRCVNDGTLEEIIVDQNNAKFSSLDGVLYTKNKARLLYYPHYKPDEKFIVPDSVSYISRGAFWGAKLLKSLTITINVSELGYNSVPTKGLEELRFENTQLPEYGFSSADPEDWEQESPRYVPDVPETIVYCVKDSNLYKVYKKSFEDPIAMCKELRTLTLFVDDTETLKKGEDGRWYYYKGKYNVKVTTLVKYQGKWFYIKNGVWDKTATDTTCWYKGKWFYIKNGKWHKNTTALMIIKNSGSKAMWTYILNGKRYDKDKDLIKYNGKWFYVVDGEWYGLYAYAEWDTPSNINTLFKKNGKWFAIIKGKWYKKKAIIKYEGKKFYVNNGFVQFKYSGKVKVDGKTYNIKKGKVV